MDDIKSMEKMTPDEIALAKAAFRSEMRSRRKALSNEEVERESLKVAEKLLKLPEFQKAELILSYSASKNEIDTSGAMRDALLRGVRVAYPLCVENGGLRLFVPNSDASMKPGKYGILEPDPEDSVEVFPEELDIIIVPGVAFNADCLRLGQGGGYYDRLLARTKAFTVGVGYDFQIWDTIPAEPHDKKLDCVITPLTTCFSSDRPLLKK